MRAFAEVAQWSENAFKGLSKVRSGLLRGIALSLVIFGLGWRSAITCSSAALGSRLASVLSTAQPTTLRENHPG